MKSSVVKRSIVLDGHKTSVSLEDAFWTDLKEIAHFQGVTLSKLVAGIDASRKQSNLSSAIRIFVLEHFHNKAERASRPHSGNAIVGSNESQSTEV
jgi:predicted DNA-binding ribbon-helix-helix protein